MIRARRAALACCWAGLLGCAIALALRWVDSTAVPVVVVQSALPLFGGVSVLLAVVAALLRGWRPLAAASALALAFGATGLPAVRSHTVAAGDDDLVVLSANLEYGGADADSLMAAVRRVRPDVVVLAEVTPDALARLDARGLDAYHSQSGAALPGATGLVVRTNMPQESIDWGEGYPQPWSPATARVTTPAGPVVVRAAHTYAPNLHDDRPWRASLTEYGSWMRDAHPGERVIVAGDFNSGWGHPGFRELARGYTDAHRAAGAGYVRTWPANRAYPPFTQLDHVLVRGLDVVDAGTADVTGTDHRAVWARLRVR